MRRNRKNRGDMVIDLTSLLDVIFIVLLVVIGSGYQNNVNINEQKKQSESEKNQLIQERDFYKTAYDAKEFVRVVPISIPYETDNVTKRKIVIPKELGLEFSEDDFTLIGTNENGFDIFKDSIVGYINSNKENPVILALNENSEDILYRDEKKMNDILDSLASEYENVYKK